jgi:ribonuclease Z
MRFLKLLNNKIAKSILQAPSYLDNLEDGLHVLLLGTGSPMANIKRAGVSTVVIAGQHTYIVDAGEGSLSRARASKLPLGKIDAMFVTHFHSDHIASAGEFMLNRWVDGHHNDPLNVYGPKGIETVVEGFNTAYSKDSYYRTEHHGSDFAPPTGAGGKAIPFELGEDKTASKPILEEDGVKVTAFNVNHHPVKPAVGYKFEYKGRSVVISGDTVYSESVLKQSKQVDLLVHEALSVELVNLINKYGDNTASKVAHDIVSYHASPEDVARIANEASVKQLVYSHIIPPVNSRYLESYFVKNAKKIYKGDMTLGNDGMIFSMPANSDKLIKKELIKN